MGFSLGSMCDPEDDSNPTRFGSEVAVEVTNPVLEVEETAVEAVEWKASLSAIVCMMFSPSSVPMVTSSTSALISADRSPSIVGKMEPEFSPSSFALSRCSGLR